MFNKLLCQSVRTRNGVQVEDLKLKCNCGKVTGILFNVKPRCGNRLVCYCKDCRNFAKYFDNADDILNEFGGTEIFQILLEESIFNTVSFIKCMRKKRQ